MKRTPALTVRSRPGFASYEFLYVIALFAVFIAIALPVVARTYPLLLSWSKAMGVPEGWPAHLVTVCSSGVTVILTCALLYLGLTLVAYGGEALASARDRLKEATNDLNAHWRERP